jgi:hypothetical protein
MGSHSQAPDLAVTDSPSSYYRASVIQCNTFWVMIIPLFRGAHRLGPQYLAEASGRQSAHA